MGETQVNSTDLQEPLGAVSVRLGFLLSDLVSIFYNLSGSGDQGDKFGELPPKFIDADVIDLEEEVGFSLLGKAHPAENEYDWPMVG